MFILGYFANQTLSASTKTGILCGVPLSKQEYAAAVPCGGEWWCKVVEVWWSIMEETQKYGFRTQKTDLHFSAQVGLNIDLSDYLS